MSNQKMCHCGRPLHYTNPKLQELTQKFVEELGEYIPVHWNGRVFLVQRHFIALHGIKAQELPNLGFQEVAR
jgi:hypothetical protein